MVSAWAMVGKRRHCLHSRTQGCSLSLCCSPSLNTHPWLVWPLPGSWDWCCSSAHLRGMSWELCSCPWAQAEPGWQFRCAWPLVSWYSSGWRHILLLHCINVLFPNRPFILTLPWWGFHVHEFQCNYISITLHVNNLKGKKKKRERKCHHCSFFTRGCFLFLLDSSLLF